MRVEISGMDDVADEFGAVAARLADPEPVMRAVRADAIAYVAQQTRSGRGPDGEAWAPFDADTVRQGGGRSVLDDLAAGMVAQSLGGASFSFGSSKDYAHFWQHGTVHMPARPFLPTARTEIVAKWVSWIETYVSTGELP